MAPARRSRRRKPSTKLLELKAKAKREGWLKWLRQGEGEEADERALLNGCWIDLHRGQHFIDFGERYCTLTEGDFDGQPFTFRDWQHEFGMRVFGWQRISPEWNRPVRRFREAYLEIAEKNGKTPFASVVGNYLLTADSFGRQVNVFTAAPTKKRGKDLNKHAIRMCKNNAELAAVTKVVTVDGFPEIHFGNNAWRIVPATEEGADGVNGCVISDEIHLWKSFIFYHCVRKALVNLAEGLFLGITTAGRNAESVCKTLHDRTIAVNAGRETQERFYGQIYAADKDDDPHDEATWFKANPSMGTTADAPLKLSDFRAEYEAAKDSPNLWPQFKQKKLNIWLSAESAWIDDFGGIEIWDAGELARQKSKKRIDCYESFTLDDLDGQLCDLALDTASILDTTSGVFSFVDDDDPSIVRVLPKFWLPETTAFDQEAQGGINYLKWRDEGHIELTPGDAVDWDSVFRTLVELGSRFRVRRIYFDPKFQADWLTQKLEDELDAERVAFEQNCRYFNAPTKTAEELIVKRKLRHNGNKVLTWQLGNTKVITNSDGHKKPLKQKHGDRRTIDGVAAMLMSLHGISDRDDDEGYYDDASNEVEYV